MVVLQYMTEDLKDYITKDAMRQRLEKHVYFKVFLDEVEPQVTGNRYTQCIAIFPKPSPADIFKYWQHTFKLEGYLPTYNVPLTQLRITITDENNKAVPLESNPNYPTLVEFDMYSGYPNDAFTITCVSHSDANLNVHPDNRLGKFVSRLPPNLDLTGYEAGLLAIAYPPRLFDESDLIITIYIKAGDKIYSRYVQQFDPTLFTTESDIVTKIKEWVEGIQLFETYLESTKKVATTLTVGSGDGSYSVSAGSLVLQRKPYSHTAPGADATAEQRTTYEEAMKKEPRLFITLTDGMSLLLNKRSVKDVEITPSGFYCPLPYNNRRAVPTSSAMLKCNLVSESAVGDSKVKLLETIPTHIMKKNLFYQPENITYHKISTRHPTAVEFEFVDPVNMREMTLNAPYLNRRKRDEQDTEDRGTNEGIVVTLQLRRADLLPQEEFLYLREKTRGSVGGVISSGFGIGYT